MSFAGLANRTEAVGDSSTVNGGDLRKTDQRLCFAILAHLQSQSPTEQSFTVPPLSLSLFVSRLYIPSYSSHTRAHPQW